MVNSGPFVTGQEGAPVLASQAEPFLLQIHPQTIQEVGNTKEAQQYQKTPPFCFLNIWKVPQEAMEDQRQTLRPVNYKPPVYQTRGHDLN